MSKTIDDQYRKFIEYSGQPSNSAKRETNISKSTNKAKTEPAMIKETKDNNVVMLALPEKLKKSHMKPAQSIEDEEIEMNNKMIIGNEPIVDDEFDEWLASANVSRNNSKSTSQPIPTSKSTKPVVKKNNSQVATKASKNNKSIFS